MSVGVTYKTVVINRDSTGQVTSETTIEHSVPTDGTETWTPEQRRYYEEEVLKRHKGVVDAYVAEDGIATVTFGGDEAAK